MTKERLYEAEVNRVAGQAQANYAAAQANAIGPQGARRKRASAERPSPGGAFSSSDFQDVA